MALIMKPPSTNEDFASGLEKAMPYYFGDPSKAHIQLENMKGSLSVWAYLNQSSQDRAKTISACSRVGQCEGGNVAGREDAVCSVAAAERTNEGIEGSRLVVWEGCGHMPWTERKEEFIEEVIKFLNGQ